MKMVFIANGSGKRTLEGFNEYNKENNQKTNQKTNQKEELGKTLEKNLEKILERDIINQSFKINMIDRLMNTATKCSSCGK